MLIRTWSARRFAPFCKACAVRNDRSAHVQILRPETDLLSDFVTLLRDLGSTLFDKNLLKSLGANY